MAWSLRELFDRILPIDLNNDGSSPAEQNPDLAFTLIRSVLVNDIVTTMVGWYAASMDESPVALYGPDGEPVETHPVLELLQDWPDYVMPLLRGYWDRGAAYLVKRKDGRGIVAKLEYVPNVIPKYDRLTGELTHYESRHRGRTLERFEIDEVLAFQYGLDDYGKPIRPLWNCLIDLSFDLEAQGYTYWLMRNKASPGHIIAVESDDLDEELAGAIEDRLDSRVGHNRGRSLVLGGRGRVFPTSFNPQELDVRQLRWMVEERVTAAGHIPSMVLGFGSGMQNSTYANYEEAIRSAWEHGVLPVQRRFAWVLSRNLLSEFSTDWRRWRLTFDVSQIRALQEDAGELERRMLALYEANAITLEELRTDIGRSPEPEGGWPDDSDNDEPAEDDVPDDFDIDDSE